MDNCKQNVDYPAPSFHNHSLVYVYTYHPLIVHYFRTLTKYNILIPQPFNTTLACPENEFQCNDGSCLDISRRCDGYVDCESGEDEAECSSGTSVAPPTSGK